MITEEAKVIYRCEHCSKRFLTKQGAKRHEEDYCYKSPIVKQKKLDKQANCEHEFHEEWGPIPGEEHRMEPLYDICHKCGLKGY